MTKHLQHANKGAFDWLVLQAERLREILLRFGGVHVAVWVMVAANALTGFYLTGMHGSLFGESATKTQIPVDSVRAMWNFSTSHAHLGLIVLAVLLRIGLLPGRQNLLWVASAGTASLWGALDIFLWIAYLSSRAPLATIHFNALIPIFLGAFVCLRLSADADCYELNDRVPLDRRTSRVTPQSLVASTTPTALEPEVIPPGLDEGLKITRDCDSL